MKSSINKLNEAKKAYEIYWDSYTKGDLETFASSLDEQFEMIGTSESEVCHSKADGIEFLKAQLHEIIGKVEMRNRQIDLVPVENLMLVNEQCDIYVLIESEWDFYSKIRLSSILRETESGWKVTQQHGSFPDMRVQEGETLAIEKISKENLELRDAVKRRTAELENKNRELAIEAALEKVRAVAMGMKKPEDMLEVCREISDRLQEFGVEKIRNIQTAIIDETIGQYLCYQYFTPYNKTAVEKTEYLKSPVEHGMVKQMLASRDGFFIGGLSDKELEAFRTHRKEENHFPDPFLDEATQLDYCFLSIGEGGLGLTLYQPMAEDVLTLFKRFHQVFSLAYQRFRDIQKAEAQTREAQIEVAVERVRAQSMAMHHPDDLDKVNKEILNQLQLLQVPGLTGVTFYLVDEDGWVKAWDFSSPGNIGDQNSYSLQYDFKKYELIGEPFEVLRQTDLNYFVADFPLEKLKRAVYELEEINTTVANLVKEALAKGILTHQWTACARISDGLLGVDLVSPPSEDTKTIVLKMAAAFNQAYTRFLDLQKAEAQARESQIQLALERVRARTMAMHKSQELAEVAVVLYQELKTLGATQDFFECGYVEVDEPNNIQRAWSTRPDGSFLKEPYYLPLTGEPVIDARYEAWKQRVPVCHQAVGGELLKRANEFVIPYMNNQEAAEISSSSAVPDPVHFYCGNFSHGYLNINCGGPLSAEEESLLARFTGVFEMTYQRFLDLQKAETRAREAQIEASLERVRSKTMAMHNSADVGESVATLFDELLILGVLSANDRCGIGIMHPDEIMEAWTAAKTVDGKAELTIGYLNMSVHPLLKAAYDGWKTKKETNQYLLEGDDKFNYYEAIRNQSDYKIKRDYFSSVERIIHTDFYFTEGCLYLFSLRETTNESALIFTRFVKAFGQTYRRYLDLRKAEAQAREAQIEAALERVRSRSLAMHNSEDLENVILVVSEQLQLLQFRFENVSFGFDTSQMGLNFWLASPSLSRPILMKVPYINNPAFNNPFQARRAGKDFNVDILSREENQEFLQHMFDHSELGNLPEENKKFLLSTSGFARSQSLMKHTILTVGNYALAPYSHDQNAILKRFGIVFEQAYVRFLDLQKAEAQAREAQIEAGLERVRSRSMAMHKSEELKEVIQLLFEQFRLLNFKIDSAQFDPNYKENDDLNLWAAAPGQPYSILLNIPYDDSPLFNSIKEAKKRGLSFITQQLSFEDKNQFFRHFFRHIKNIPAERQKLIFESPGMYRAVVFMENVSLAIQNYSNTVYTEEENEVLKRFGKTFEQVYTRFLDLQKAEAQARESQIEAALERVRSRSMAMHDSKELGEVAKVMFNQMKLLGAELFAFGIVLCDKDKNVVEQWHGLGEGDMMTPFQVPIDLDYIHRYRYDQWKAGVELFSIEIPSDYIARHFELMFALQSVKAVMDDLKLMGIELGHPSWEIDYGASFKYGYLLVSSLQPYSEEKIFPRFAKVFEQAYTRFLDLQKAEAQAREAQIEAALERVRSTSLAMHNSQDLSKVVYIVFTELVKLDAKLDRCLILTVNPQTLGITWYLSGKEGLLSNNGFLVADNPHPSHQAYLEGWRTKRKNWHYLLAGEEKKSCDHFLFSQTELAQLPDFIKADMAAVESIHLSISSDDFGCLIASSFSPLSEVHAGIVDRFTTVFNQTYTRFLDLQKAEAQAREAQIEVGLERVRARTMAMHSSNDVSMATATLFTELEKLGVQNLRGGIAIISPDQTQEVWSVNHLPEGITLRAIGIFDMRLHPFWRQLFKAFKTKEEFQYYWLAGEDKANYIALLNTTPHYLEQPITDLPDVHIQSYFFGEGAIWTNSLHPHSESEKQLMKKFVSVFSLTFRRYLDLKKAEAQAREAQIEASMEKVRSRSLAMQQPEELLEVAEVLREEMGHLGVEELETSSIYIVDNEHKQAECWYAIKDIREENKKLVRDEMSIRLDDTWVGHEMWKFYTSMKGQDSIVMKGDNRMEWINYCAKRSPVLQGYYGLEIPERTYHLVKFNGGYMGAASPGDISSESWDLLKRAAAVFSFAYTRFKDLQDAAARAKEAQIELALERVRSRSMAMHKSEELLEAGEILFLEMQKLGIVSLTAGYVLFDKEGRNGLNYTPHPGTKKIMPVPVIIPHNETIHMQQVVESWKKGQPFFVVEMDEEETIKHQTFIAERSTNFPLTAAQLIAISPAKLFLHNFYFKEGYILIVGGIKLTAEQTDIMLRFAKVFQQTYTRFLDLQKAEAQARESQIQLALERVRARTMAMQRSDELPEAANLLFQQVQSLGMPAWSAGYCTWVDDKRTSVTLWMSSEGVLQPPFTAPTTEDELFIEMRKGQESGKAFHVVEMGGDKLVRHYQYMRTLPVVGNILDSIIKAGHPLPTFQIMHQAYFSKGFLLFITYEPVQESHDIFIRFAQVFDQTYTRFLDLQKAEAQAREAQIEAALEKVRSRSMAMHSSQELKEVALELRKQMGKLGQKDLETCAIHLYGKGEDFFESWSAMKVPDSEIEIVQTQAHFPKNGIPIVDEMMRHYNSGSRDYVLVNEGEKIEEWFKVLKKHAPELHASILDSIGNAPVKELKANWSVADFSGGALVMVTYGEPDEVTRNLLRRSANVFEQAYTRFLDLQKAEAQAREAQIQLSLERIRAKAMAMQQSDELSGFLTVLFEQFAVLNLSPVYCHLTFFDIDNNRSTYRMTGKKGATLIATQEVDLDASPVWKQQIEEWKAGNPNDVDVLYIPFESIPGVAEIFKEILEKLPDDERPQPEDFPDGQYVIQGYCKYGYLGYNSTGPASDEEKEITRRIATEFGNVYQRFLDLQKAEAQAREAQIQLSLERIRAKAMAMQHSDELSDFLTVVFEQFHVLNLRPVNSQLSLLDLDNNRSIFRLTGKNGAALIATQEVDLDASPIWKQKVEDFKSGQPNDVDVLYIPLDSLPEISEIFKEILSKLPEDERPLPEAYPNGQYIVEGSFKYGYLGYSASSPPSDEEKEITRRIANEFGNVYQRFLDLQKAEAQARESQIQLALERVRARTMAMQRSEELPEVAGLLFQQVKTLGVPQFHCGFNIFEIDDKECTWYPGSADGDILPPCKIPLTEHPIFMNFIESRKRGDELCVYEKEGEYQAGHYRYMLSLPVLGEILQNMLDAGIPFPTFQIDHLANFSHGNLLFITSKHFPEMHDTFKRFAKVFEQTYTRFLDLQKAEAQARETQIQLALERVRARTMAMQSSEELAEVSFLLNKQVVDLGIPTRGCAFNIYNEHDSTEWFSNLEGTFPSYKTPRENIFLKYYEAGQRGESLLIEAFGGERIKELYKYFATLNDSGDESINDHVANAPDYQINHMAYFKYGYLLFVTLVPAPEAHDVFKRFSKEFEQTYTRFLDLQKAEAQARESQIEAALEKVRGRTMAMQSSDELADAAYVLFEQLNFLGVTHERINIGIVNEDNHTIDFWVTEQGGDKLSTKFSGRISEPTTLSKAYKAWKKGEKSLVVDLTGEELKRWLHYLNEEIKIPFNTAFLHSRRVQTAGFFSKGMLIVTSPEPLKEEALYLLEKFAGVFDLTYTRFNDLKIAEAHAQQAEKDLIEIKIARQNAEDALSELKSTQAQLVQQEKLASLGQLTAGIAHEIKNPLNFVNNFSEVSLEMIEEAIEERSKNPESRDETLVDEILEDIKSNMKKVHEHGSRANGIVSSMLQHSRGSSGKMEPTDLNTLIREYTNLSFHGMRAGKNPINVDIILELDPEIKEVSLIKEDFTRVIINLCNNAFDAMRGKVDLTDFKGYHPSLKVSTSQLPTEGGKGGYFKIAIQDNGPGIPDEIKDKILQPFFTTKKGTEGTGLGLSITHDIIKAHGGELEIETSVNKGTTFIIKLNK